MPITVKVNVLFTVKEQSKQHYQECINATLGGRYGTRGILAYTAHETDFHRLCSIGDSSFTHSLCPRLNPNGQRSRFRDAVDRLSRAARRKLNPRTLGAPQLLANVCLWHKADVSPPHMIRPLVAGRR